MQKIRLAPWIGVLSILAAGSHAHAGCPIQDIRTADGSHRFIPLKSVEFKAVETDPDFNLPSTQTDYPHCLADGSLVLQSVDWDGVDNQLKRAPAMIPRYDSIISIVREKKVQSILTPSISDLTDFEIRDIFPTDSGVYLLLRGTKAKAGERGSGTSQAGIPWKTYRYFVAKFDLDGSYKGADELGGGCDMSHPDHCDLIHLAVFPNGNLLVTESDPVTSTFRLLYLKSSGEVVKQIDGPASRKPMNLGDTSSNPELRRAATMFLSSIFFTAVGENVLVWQANSNDPVVEVTEGGGVREVPLEIPQGWRFADMVSSNDRWVVHFRTEDTPPTARMSDDVDAYYDVRPQDGSLAAKIVQKGDAPHSIACESNGTYTSFKMNNAGKMVLLHGN